MTKSHFFWFCLIALVPAFLLAQTWASDIKTDFVQKEIIVIDPGHGGHDLGTLGPTGVPEKDLTLELAKKLKDALTDKYTVKLTREGDYWLDIERRTAIANNSSGKIFISLHAGTDFHYGPRGMAVFFFQSAVSERLQNRHENILDVKDKLHPWRQLQYKHLEASRKLASHIYIQLAERFDTLPSGAIKVPLLVLEGADMPAVLIEIGHVTHLKKDNIGTADIAKAIGEGIKAHFRETSGCISEKRVLEEDIGPGRGAVW